MTRTSISLLLFLFSIQLVAQSPEAYTTNSRIEVRFSDLKNKDIILGHHFGQTQYTVDTARVNENGVAVFQNKGDTVRYGVYLIFVPGVKYFDILLSEEDIVLETSLSDPVADMKVIKSRENTLFFNYLNYITDRQTEMETLIKSKESAIGSVKESLLQREQLLKNQANAYLRQMRKNNQGTLAAAIIGVNQQPDIPDAPQGVEAPKDWQYYYFKDHFWDDTELEDERLLYSPWFTPKLERYITKLTLQAPDSVANSARRVIDGTGENREMYRFVVNWITNHYETSSLMNAETMFVHMVNNYYSDNKAWWVDPAKLYGLRDRAKRLEPLLIEKKIPNLVLKDPYDNFQNLHNSGGDYTLLFFYKMDCKYCDDAIPILHEMATSLEGKNITYWGVALDLENSEEDREKNGGILSQKKDWGIGRTWPIWKKDSH